MCTEIEKSEVNSSQLACPHRLRYLNLDNNEIYTIPQLKLIGTSPLKVTTDKHTSTQYTTLTHAASKENDEESAISTDARIQPSSVKLQASEHITTTLDTAKVSPVPGAIRTDLSPPIHAPPNTAQKSAKPLSKHLLESTLQKPHHVKTCGESTPTLLTVDPPDGLPGPPGRLSPSHSVAPFPQLETLSLANNLVSPSPIPRPPPLPPPFSLIPCSFTHSPLEVLPPPPALFASSSSLPLPKVMQ